MPAATRTRMEADVEPWAPRPAGTRNPCRTRNATSENQKSTLSTTAEPMPWVPSANPVSAPVTPDWVSSR